MHTSTRVGLLIGLSLCSVPMAAADEVVFDCAIDSTTSTLTQTTDLTAPFAGTLIGDYDAVNNPTGTRTLPGVFGGTGNNPIPYTASFVVAGDIVSRPTGTLVLGVDSEGLQIRVSGLEVDMLGAVPASLANTVNINYQTFRTVQPSSLYPGGVTVPVPVGNANINRFDATQTGKGVFGALIPQKDGSFQFTVAVPVLFTVEATALGQPIGDGTPSPGVLPLTGRLIEGANSVTLELDISNAQSSTQPVEAEPFVNIALDLPTVLPTGSVAHLLMSGDVTSVTLSTTLNASLDAAGTRQPRVGDINGDFVVDATDLTLFLANWGGTGAGDFNGDGAVGGADLSLLLANWG